MKILLIADVKKVGRRGEVKEVANGYAMNVLIPQRLAIPGTPENLKRAINQKEQAAEKRSLDETLLAKSIQELSGKTLHIKARSNEKGILFKTIRAREVAEAIATSFGVSIPESAVQMDGIEGVGEYSAKISGGSASLLLPITIVAS